MNFDQDETWENMMQSAGVWGGSEGPDPKTTEFAFDTPVWENTASVLMEASISAPILLGFRFPRIRFSRH